MSGQPLLAGDLHLVAEDELAATLETQLRGTLGKSVNVSAVERRFSDYYSSYIMEELDVRLDDGRELQLIFKNLSRDGMLEGAIRTKPFFLYNPMREIDSYRTLLAARNIGTAKFYGAYTDRQSEEYWLFIERVPGTLLWQFGDDETWQRVCSWLGSMHRGFAPEVRRRSETHLPHLTVYTEHYYWQWMARAQAFVERTACSSTEPGCNIDYLADRFPEVVDRLKQLPLTVIHGELYPSNVLVQAMGDQTRVCPVDWETAAVGPGLMDLAAVTSGGWTEEQRLQMAMAYFHGAGDEMVAGKNEIEFLVDLDYCSLFMAIQWLGWSPDWAPPPEHAQNWLSEACRLARKLSL